MICRLAFKDLAHEWLLSLCLVLAVAAILAPLMVLFGLKTGVIETMRGRLVMDPRNREIRPMTSASFGREWFEQTARDPRVAFVIPMTRQISSSVDLVHGDQSLRLTVLSTAAGDPLLTENGAPAPGPDQCVLSASAAQAAGLAAGDEVELRTRRLRGGAYESASVRLRVAGVLDERAGALKAVYVPLETLEAVEDYKDGRAVPRFGWEGSMPLAYPLYDGVLVFLPHPLDKLELLDLVSNTGFHRTREVQPGETPTLCGLPLAPGWRAYLVESGKKPAGEESVAEVRRRLRGRGALLLPWVRPLEAELRNSGGETRLTLFAAARDAAQALEHGNLDLPQEGRTLLLNGAAAGQGEARLMVRHKDRGLEFPVETVSARERIGPGQALLAARILGICNLLRQRNVTFDAKSGDFLLARRGYAGFRLYARTIDDVAPLEEDFEARGLPVHTERARIAEVKRLDRYLGLIFQLIALIGLVGGMAALTASLYASVERKKRELNTLRLLGLSRFELVRFPVWQGLGLAGGGLAVAWLLFHGVATTINTLFASHLRGHESLCRLSLPHLAAIAAGVLGIGVAAAALAAFRATTMDPAEALREE